MKLNFFASNTPKLEWQKLKSKQKQIPDLFRTAVPGGWLISTGGDAPSLTFVPDFNHEWDGESLDLSEEDEE